MLFNSFEFILAYLPVTLAAFFWIARSSHRLAALWLAASSLFFYGWWNPKFVLLLLASITLNYAMGYAIGHARGTARAKHLLFWAIAANLGCLAYYKYTNFFIATVNGVAGVQWGLAEVVLPLGISFFTFTQIAFLVDVSRGIAREYNFIHYILFVTYFPHLIAGPVLHHKQMMPQFADPATYEMRSANIAAGLAMFTIGLAKKVLVADSFAEYATPFFDASRDGVQPGFIAAWTGALAYTLQLYFDFSGYSDMAVGLSRLFGVSLPLNFNSPYKATSIVDFWRRWHMTLSQFLRDYLYIPLGGNRLGGFRRHLNLMATMLLGGLWHGANWTFVAWGGLHGAYLVLNHLWGGLRARIAWLPAQASLPERIIAFLLTQLAVVVAWVFFRAETFGGALRMLRGMVAVDEVTDPELRAAISFETAYRGFAVPPDSFAYFGTMLVLGLGIAWFAPNSQAIVERLRTDSVRRNWFVTGACLAVILLLAVINASRGVSEFIYFNF